MNIDEYERQGREKYGAFSVAVAGILFAAIGTAGEYRLQQVTNRAKHQASLRKKLRDRNLEASNDIDKEIKDLAGCRVIFYTNGDVARFINSGLIQQNFDVIDVKLHHPKPASDDAVELYISNHYVVSLREERVSLPEYVRFAGMRCEIQVQTILNHAWAEMAHDTIYKEPALGNFGGKALNAIKARMAKVARKYLVPAGYEFQKIAYDFQRLVQGKELFDGDALEAIVAAPNNNVRAEALETFVESVLPLYDDPEAVYPEVVKQLLLAADNARREQPVPIETPYGTLPAKTYKDISKAVSEVLERYRYLDVELTFSGLCTLHGLTENAEERESLIELAKSLSKYQLEVWRQYGPAVQAQLVELIGALNQFDRIRHGAVLIPMLESIVGTEVSSTTSSFGTMTFHRGAVMVSDSLRAVRSGALELLKRQFFDAENECQRRAVISALRNSANLPMGRGYSPELAQMLAEDRSTILKFLTSVVSSLDLQVRQEVEDWVHRSYWNAAVPALENVEPGLLNALENVRAAALAFRDEVNSDVDFVTYKVLVGFNSVYPPAWEDKDFHYEQADEYRKEQVAELLASVTSTNADQWFERISRYARTESDDLATFPVFGRFLTDLATRKPEIVLSFMDRMEVPLEKFLPAMLDGLMQSSERERVAVRLHAWIDDGVKLHDIAWYLQFADPFDQELLMRTFESASSRQDLHTVRNALLAAVNQYRQDFHALIDKVFLPALNQLTAASDPAWVRIPMFSWHKRPIIYALDERQAKTVLDCLVSQLRLESSVAQIVASIAKRWPAIVIDFLGQRQELARSEKRPESYDALPFEVHNLRKPLAENIDLLLHAARDWHRAYPDIFPYDGGQLIASVFPGLPDELFNRLEKLISDGEGGDLKFVLSILSAFEGIARVFEIVRLIVAKVDPNGELLAAAVGAIQPTGVVRGEFGFAEAYSARRDLLLGWLDDSDERVRAFAKNQISVFERRIAAEIHSAETSIALRKLNFGEELDDGDSMP